MTWQPIDLRDDDPRWYMDDPGDVFDALADLLEGRPWWHEYAACRGQGTRTFFTRRGEDTEPAKAICAGCSVREDCLDAALALSPSEDSGGVWGGTSSRQRRQLRKNHPQQDAA